MTSWYPLALSLVAVVAVACTDASVEDEPEIANPASEYCIEQGGRLELRDDVEGNQLGTCVFPDGSECEEWAFFRGECAPGGG